MSESNRWLENDIAEIFGCIQLYRLNKSCEKTCHGDKQRSRKHYGSDAQEYNLAFFQISQSQKKFQHQLSLIFNP
jgi:hypothetical protein